MNILKFIKDHSTTILCALGCAGVVGTGVSAALCSKKTSEKLQEAREANGGTLTFKGATKAVAVSQWPTAVVGVTTMACIIGSECINASEKAALISAVGAGATAVWRKAKDIKPMTKEEQDMTHEKGEELFYEDNYGYFWANPYDVMSALCMMHKRSMIGAVGIYEFYQDLGIIDDIIKGWNKADLGWDIETLYEFPDEAFDISKEIYYTEDKRIPYHNIIFPLCIVEMCHADDGYPIPDSECAKG